MLWQNIIQKILTMKYNKIHDYRPNCNLTVRSQQDRIIIQYLGTSTSSVNIQEQNAIIITNNEYFKIIYSTRLEIKLRKKS